MKSSKSPKVKKIEVKMIDIIMFIKILQEMDNLIVGRRYFVTELDRVWLKEFHTYYRAKFGGIQQGINKFVLLSEHIYNNDNRMRTYLSVVPIHNIIKIETLKDIVNELLPNEILIHIENYL
jgi:hypothetical protein